MALEAESSRALVVTMPRQTTPASIDPRVCGVDRDGRVFCQLPAVLRNCCGDMDGANGDEDVLEDGIEVVADDAEHPAQTSSWNCCSAPCGIYHERDLDSEAGDRISNVVGKTAAVGLVIAGKVQIKSAQTKRPGVVKNALDENKHAPEDRTWQTTSVGKQLVSLQKKHPYLVVPSHLLYTNNNGHYLSNKAKPLIQYLNALNEIAASQILERLKEEALFEDETLAPIFGFFNLSRSDSLRMRDVGFMLTFFGFPAEKRDVQYFMDSVGKENLITFKNFQSFVHKMGGSLELFEMRKSKQLRNTWIRNGLLEKEETVTEAAMLRNQVEAEVGIDHSSQAYWRLVAPISEMRATLGLKKCQRLTLAEIRAQAQKSHEKALPELQARYEKLGYKADDVFVTLAWIRESAPIIIHIDLPTLLPSLRNDTHFRNQFETHVTGGSFNIEGKKQRERDLYCGQYDGSDVKPSDRCKYGYLNVMNDYRGVARSGVFGASYIVLKDVRLRCTFSPRDSGNLTPDKLAVLDHFAHQLLDYSDAELKEVIKVANSGQLFGESTVMQHLQYKEAQIHGDINFQQHVDRLVVADVHNGTYMTTFINELCEKHGWRFSWVSDERKRFEDEQRLFRLGASRWQKALNVKPLAAKTPPNSARKNKSSEPHVPTNPARRRSSSVGEVPGSRSSSPVPQVTRSLSRQSTSSKRSTLSPLETDSNTTSTTNTTSATSTASTTATESETRPLINRMKMA